MQNVTIIEGPTGCGKTTQVPMWILEEAFKRESRCNIITTQPRRIAAMTVAKQVCRENNVKLGDLIGYQVTFVVKIIYVYYETCLNTFSFHRLVWIEKYPKTLV